MRTRPTRLRTKSTDPLQIPSMRASWLPLTRTMAGWHATARIRQCDWARESASRTVAGPRHRFCEWNTNRAIPSLQNHHIRHLTPALLRAICVSLFPPLCSRAHDISPRERIASPAARFRRMSRVGSIVRRVEGNSRRYGAAYSAASRMAASLAPTDHCAAWPGIDLPSPRKTS